jgi:hypothetical protein
VWVAVEFDNVCVLFSAEHEESLSWLKKVYGIGATREEAIIDLERRLSCETEKVC